MKPITPHDPLDDLIAAALHGDLSPEERTQFESRLAHDPAAQAAYNESKAMHDLLEKTHAPAQPDPAFEQRMVSAVRRKLQNEPHRETAWESVLVMWRALRKFPRRIRLVETFAVLGILAILAGVALGPITAGIRQSQVKGIFSTITSQLAVADNEKISDPSRPSAPVSSLASPISMRLAHLEKAEANAQAQLRANPYDQAIAQRLTRIEAQKQLLAEDGRIGMDFAKKSLAPVDLKWHEPSAKLTPQGGTIRGSGFAVPADSDAALAATTAPANHTMPAAPAAPITITATPSLAPVAAPSQIADAEKAQQFDSTVNSFNVQSVKIARGDGVKPAPVPPAAETPASDDRKLIRNAQLDLEVKSYQAAMDQITSLTKSAGGYVDTSNSQKGGNGKLQGTVVVKILPQNLDDFLFKLRHLGEVKNQSVSTDDVTKDYFDTQARLANSQKMEVQLQDLLKRENGKVSDLLAVERELGRVRGEIEQMQGQLKLYDFQVQYATVTMQMAEKDLKQTAAYLLKEQDDFSLFATDVEGTFQSARKAAEDSKAQVLVANLNHNSGSDVSAQLVFSVPPDQIESLLAQVRGLGRVANFTRNTNRVAQDGGDSAQPADQTLTEKDKVMVNVSIRSDDETRKQVAMTVVTKTVDDALDKAKTVTMAQTGAAILSSSLNKTPEGQSTAQISVRVPGKSYAALMEAFRGLGRTASLSVQRNDDAGPGTSGDDAPVIVTLALTDDDAPLQTTEMAVVGSDVDGQSQQIKKDAAAAGVEVKSSSFVQQPDGTETAQMSFRMPMAKYNSFLASIQKLGKTESLSVQRNDRPDEAMTDDDAPAEIDLQLHNQRGIVAENNGLGATLRQTFGEGAEALFGSVRVIGVLIAFTLPWLITLAVLAWIARRIYVWRKSK